jgi:hypothetical protein
MPASFIGLPTTAGSTAKVLESSEFAREITGLETLTETYTVRSSLRISLTPDRNTLHTAFSTAETKFPRMSVENVSFSEIPGGLTKMTVTFVGLTASSGMPPPVVRMLPVPGKMFIEAEYVSTETEDSLVQIGKTTRMPSTINGYAMPANPGPIVTSRGGGAFLHDTATELGFCYETASATRRGQFLVVRATFRKKTIATGIFFFRNDL